MTHHPPKQPAPCELPASVLRPPKYQAELSPEGLLTQRSPPYSDLNPNNLPKSLIQQHACSTACPICMKYPSVHTLCAHSPSSTTLPSPFMQTSFPPHELSEIPRSLPIRPRFDRRPADAAIALLEHLDKSRRSDEFVTTTQHL